MTGRGLRLRTVADGPRTRQYPFSRAGYPSSRRSHRIVSALKVLALVAPLAACGQYQWHQRVTIEVEAGGTTYTGSSVTQVVVQRRLFKLFGVPLSSDVYGEAPLVDLGGRGVVVAALRDMDFGLAMTAFRPRIEELLSPQTAAGLEKTNASLQMLQSNKWVASVPPRATPMLLYFPRPHDPKSVAEIPRDERALRGARVKSVTIELTDDPLTREALGPIGWVYSLGNRRLDGTTHSVERAPLANRIYRNDFVREQ